MPRLGTQSILHGGDLRLAASSKPQAGHQRQDGTGDRAGQRQPLRTLRVALRQQRDQEGPGKGSDKSPNDHNPGRCCSSCKRSALKTCSSACGHRPSRKISPSAGSTTSRSLSRRSGKEAQCSAAGP